MSTKQSWRDRLKVHDAAALFPPLGKEELHALANDIKAHDLRERVACIKEHDGTRVVVDGCGRLDALELLDKDIFGVPDQTFQELRPGTDPVEYVMSANIHRRHLTGGQKREAIRKLLEMMPEKSNRQIGGMIKASHHTVEAIRTKMESTGQIAQFKKTIGKDGKPRSTKRKHPREKLAKVIPSKPEIEKEGEVGNGSAEDTKRPVPAPTPDPFSPYLSQVTAVVEEMFTVKPDDMDVHAVFERVRRHIDEMEQSRSPSVASPKEDDGLDIPPCLRREPKNEAPVSANALSVN
jgi:hypothetical protein